MLFVYHVPSCRQSALAIYYVFLQQCQFRKPKTLHNNRVKALHSLGIQLYLSTTTEETLLYYKQGAVFGLRETGSVIGPPLMAISNFDMQ